MPRKSINRSISFDPELFSAMEERRSKLMMERSDYVKRCILRDMLANRPMEIGEVPSSLVKKPNLRGKGITPRR